MTDTLVSIISIFMGMLGANILSFVKNKFNLGFTGNTIAGIFGSIFLIKVFGRLGFGPQFVMQTGAVNIILFLVNILMALVGGALGLILAKFIIKKLSKTE